MTHQEQCIWEALNFFKEKFRVLIISLLDPKKTGNWEPEFRYILYSKINNAKQNNWDREIKGKEKSEFINCIDFAHFEIFADKRRDLFEQIFQKEKHHLPTRLSDLKKVRDDLVHYDSANPDDMDKAWINMKQIAEIIKDVELQDGLKKIKNKIGKQDNTSVEESKNLFNANPDKIKSNYNPQLKINFWKNIKNTLHKNKLVIPAIAISLALITLFYFIYAEIKHSSPVNTEKEILKNNNSIKGAKEVNSVVQNVPKLGENLTDYNLNGVYFKSNDNCYISIGQNNKIAFRNRPLTQDEINISNSCLSGNFNDNSEVCIKKQKIDNETYIGSINNGLPVIFLGKISDYFKIKELSTNKIGYISYKLFGKNTLINKNPQKITSARK